MPSETTSEQGEEPTTSSYEMSQTFVVYLPSSTKMTTFTKLQRETKKKYNSTKGDGITWEKILCLPRLPRNLTNISVMFVKFILILFLQTCNL